MPRARHRPRTAACGPARCSAACASTRDGGGARSSRASSPCTTRSPRWGSRRSAPSSKGLLAEGQTARVTLRPPGGLRDRRRDRRRGRRATSTRRSSTARGVAARARHDHRAAGRPATLPRVGGDVRARREGGCGRRVLGRGDVGRRSATGGARGGPGRARAANGIVRGADPAEPGRRLRLDHARGARQRRVVRPERLARARVPARRLAPRAGRPSRSRRTSTRSSTSARTTAPTPNAEVDCNDDGPDRTHSRIERVLDPGKYFVFVDGYGQESGTFKMNVTTSDVLALAEVCRKAPVARRRRPAVGDHGRAWPTTRGRPAAAGREGADAAWRAEIASRSRVRIVEHSDEMAPIVHVRRACADEQSEVACGEGGGSGGDAAVTGVFDPGTLHGLRRRPRARLGGDATRSCSRLRRPRARAPAGDGCGDALPLAAGPAGTGGHRERRHVRRARRRRGELRGRRAPRPRLPPRRPAAIALRRPRSTARRRRTSSSLWRRCASARRRWRAGARSTRSSRPGRTTSASTGRRPTPSAASRSATRCGTSRVRGRPARAAPALVDGPRRSARRRRARRTSSSRRAAPATRARAGRTGSSRSRSRRARRSSSTSRRRGSTPPSRFARRARDARAAPGDVELGCESDADAGHRTSSSGRSRQGPTGSSSTASRPNDQGPFTIKYRIAR